MRGCRADGKLAIWHDARPALVPALPRMRVFLDRTYRSSLRIISTHGQAPRMPPPLDTLPFRSYRSAMLNAVSKWRNTMKDDAEAGAGGASKIIAFRCPADLRARIEQAAAIEGLSNSAVARRAVLRDLRARERKEPDHAA
jgi:hypothetical protein